jgi:hypothetical protein
MVKTKKALLSVIAINAESFARELSDYDEGKLTSTPVQPERAGICLNGKTDYNYRSYRVSFRAKNAALSVRYRQSASNLFPYRGCGAVWSRLLNTKNHDPHRTFLRIIVEDGTFPPQKSCHVGIEKRSPETHRIHSETMENFMRNIGLRENA